MARDPERRRVSRQIQNVRRKAARRVAQLRRYAKSTKNQAEKKRYQKAAKNLQAAIKRSSISRSDTLEKAATKLYRLEKNLEMPTAKRSNEFIKNEMKRAMDQQTGTIFGSGAEARARVKEFFLYYSKDWESSSYFDRYETIMEKHPGSSLYDLYEDMKNARTTEGLSFEQYLLRFSEFSNVDTTDIKWQKRVMEIYDNLASPTQKEYAQGYYSLVS